MALFIISAIGLPVLAIIFFSILEAAFTQSGIWDVLSNAGLDTCRISLGIVGGLFFDVQIQAAATIAALMLLLDLIFNAAAMLVSNRAADLGITHEAYKTYWITA
jgi:hypothetical protein